MTSPYSSIKLSQFETDSNKNNSEVKQNNDNQQQVNSSSRMWSVEKMIFKDNYSPKVKDELSIVKKCLFKEITVADEVLGNKQFIIYFIVIDFCSHVPSINSIAITIKL